jgi:hypothetical protein
MTIDIGENSLQSPRAKRCDRAMIRSRGQRWLAGVRTRLMGAQARSEKTLPAVEQCSFCFVRAHATAIQCEMMRVRSLLHCASDPEPASRGGVRAHGRFRGYQLHGGTAKLGGRTGFVQRR